MPRHHTTCLAILATAALTACGDGAPRPAADAPPAATAVASADRYCALVAELDGAGEEHFASLGRNATPKQYEAAERAFVESQAARLRELEAAAPAEIAADVRTLLAAQRERAGLPAGEHGDEQAAEKRLHAYEREHC